MSGVLWMDKCKVPYKTINKQKLNILIKELKFK